MKIKIGLKQALRLCYSNCSKKKSRWKLYWWKYVTDSTKDQIDLKAEDF